MDSSITPFFTPLFFYFLTFILAPIAVSGANSNLFVEYIGAGDGSVKFSDDPINSDVDFHFILSFAIDYTNVPATDPTPTNGEFSVFWDTDHLSPYEVSAIKQNYPNVKVAVSLGGDSISEKDDKVYFAATSVESWVSNAVDSLTTIIQDYHLDGIDIDYENFTNPDDTETFTECIGQLITTLKNNSVISFVSIAPFADPDNQARQTMYEALWPKYSSVIDYVNFQFYGYGIDTTIEQYVQYYDEQVSNYPGANILASFTTENTNESCVISADTGLNVCRALKSKDILYGIFIWSADESLMSEDFSYEIKAQELLAS